MKLPIFNPLLSDQSTYITFSKSLLDLDRATNNETGYIFTKLVALNLPDFKEPDFFIDLSEVDILTDNPNTVFPKGLQYYMENIIRQSVPTENIVELAFWKFLNKCGLSYDDIQSKITFINKISTSNFIYAENNNGWSEIVGVIPNKCDLLTTAFKTISEVPDIVTSDEDNNQDGIFDNGNKEFLFTDPKAKQVIDFDNILLDQVEENSFDFNVLLVFYTDIDGIDKLHGINFINNFTNKITHFELPKFTQKTNDARSVGYQFKMNMKTCNNEASLILIQDYNSDGTHWNSYFETLTKFGTFLEKEMTKGQIV